jgi:hypothetical protein
MVSVDSARVVLPRVTLTIVWALCGDVDVGLSLGLGLAGSESGEDGSCRVWRIR